MGRVIRTGEGHASATNFDLVDIALEARQVVAAARRKAADLLARALTEARGALERAHRQGYARGHAEGLAAGHEEGRRLAREDTLKELRAGTEHVAPVLEKLLGEIDRRKDTLLMDARADLLDLSIGVAERILRTRIEGDRQAALGIFARAVELCAQRTDLIVHCRPQDREALEAFLPELDRRLGDVRVLEWRADSTLGPGDCRIRYASGEVDASIGIQLDRVREAFLGPRGDERI